MFLPDLPVSVAFGALIALSNGAATGTAEARARTLRQTLAYGLLFHLPDSFSAFLWYPDWNLGYFVPWADVGYDKALLLEGILLSCLFLGAWVAMRLGKHAWLAVAGGFVMFAGVMAYVWDRYQHVGTYAEYQAGAARVAAGDATFQMFTAMAGAYLVVPFTVLIVTNILENRKPETG